MTFVHFVNCMALAYAPYVVTYKSSVLSEYNAFFKCVFAGLIYMCTQLAKMMTLATFFPSFETSTISGSPDVFNEAIKTLVDFADVVGIYFVINRTIGKPELKILTAAIGWGGAQALFSNIFSFWFGARSQEFDWKYIQLALNSNITLVHIMCMAALTWIWTRTDLKSNLRPFVTFFLVVCVYRDMLVQSMVHSLMLTPWFSLLFKAIATLFVGMFSIQLYAGITEGS